ncbi:hypothetical protein SCOR_15355 [Sulfidibacter corallicola]|uniref:Uncharacterized protein n=1 Tax=Sulfidibacter corallicola TaxID=2818388 RepID=A0A8A4U5Y3_SULCO|nr:hypothetical protein [Sulfidibacter corallicola]QTD54155.1 hypothetical protein J3U87_17050 [Sulfidibacter corallicola]
MLFEQAFMSLPEFLTGLPYQSPDFEGTLLSAFSMAVLQELNGRNINNPISCLRSEVKYRDTTEMRADLHLDLEAMKILTPELKQYGIYQHNWLEAKYFRLNINNKPTIDSLKVVLLLLKDIIRLVTLPPENNISDSKAARYLLHAYQGDPKKHIAKKKNTKNNIRGFTRSWATKMQKSGSQTIETLHLKDEVKQLDSVTGSGLRSLEFQLDIMNFTYEPKVNSEEVFSFYLSRIDDFKISEDSEWYMRKDGKITESSAGAMKKINQAVITGLITS